MLNHETALCRRVLIGALVALILMAAGPGWCQPAQSQEGLPVDLVIPEDPPLSEQLTTMQALYESGLSYVPRTGILDSIKNMFMSSEQANYLPVPQLAEAAAQLRGELVQTEGIYETDGETGVLRSLGGEIAVELMGGTQPEGFAASDGDPNGMPVAISGRVETQGDAPLLRAETLIPSALIAGVRAGRIAERQEDWEAAVEAYQGVADQGALSTRPLAAFARIRAGQVLLERVKDQKQARAQFSRGWQPYSVEANGGQPVYYTWMPVPGDGWEKVSAAEAIAPRLNRLNSETLAYKIVDIFVRLAGNSAPLGVILMAIVVRLAIFPLTKKQLESQRRMQAIQPQIKELQQKHATDKQKFQEEFWALCQENNCNPLGGCLPMLIQMPILIFLYRGIQDYIVQFSGEGFLWVSNLAQPNMTLLILYTLSMVAFQKMAAQATPTTDPQQAQQQKMMAYMMPLMFFFFFQSFPAAFILYWLGSNIIYFGEQALFVYRRKNGADEAGETGGKPAEAEKPAKSGGFVGAMMDAAKRMRGDEAEEEKRPLSFAEKRQQEKQRRQEKQRKRRKAR